VLRKVLFGVSVVSLAAVMGISAQEVVLDFPSWQAEEPGFAEWWHALIVDFEAQHPGVKINLYYVPYPGYVDSLTTRFAAGDPPDIVHLPARNFAAFAAQGWLEPLDELLAKTDILETWTTLQRTDMVWEGETQGVLLMGYGYVFYYNAKLLQDAGLEVPQNLDELIAAAKALTTGEVYGYGCTTTLHPNMYPDITKIVYGQGLCFEKDGALAFTDPAVLQAIEQYRELAKCAPQGLTTEMYREYFINGKIAMIMDGPWVLALLDRAPEEIRPYLKYARPPTLYVTGGSSNSIHIPRGLPSEKRDLVWEFIKLLATPEWQAKYTLMTRSPAPRKGVLTPEMAEAHPDLEFVNKLAAEAISTWPRSPNLLANYTLYAKLIAEAATKLIVTEEPTLAIMKELEERLHSEGLAP